MDKQKKFLIIGGGIAGLAAGFYVQQYAAEFNLPVSTQIIEQEPSFGGKILTERMDGFVIEGGPDTFISTKPWAVTLCRELGIDDRLHGTNPEFNKTYILHNNRLHRLPGGLTMMIPTEIFPMLTTGLLSWRGKARMAMDFFLPPANGAQDESMGEFVTRRLGREAYERLVEPLMSGIYAGDGDKLSLQATLPYLLDLEGKYGGLVRGALAVRKSRARNGKSAQGSRSLFQTPRTGLAEIVEALVAALQKSGATLRTEVEADELRIDSGMPKLQLSESSMSPPQQFHSLTGKGICPDSLMDMAMSFHDVKVEKLLPAHGLHRSFRTVRRKTMPSCVFLSVEQVRKRRLIGLSLICLHSHKMR